MLRLTIHRKQALQQFLIDQCWNIIVNIFLTGFIRMRVLYLYPLYDIFHWTITLKCEINLRTVRKFWLSNGEPICTTSFINGYTNYKFCTCPRIMMRSYMLKQSEFYLPNVPDNFQGFLRKYLAILLPNVHSKLLKYHVTFFFTTQLHL